MEMAELALVLRPNLNLRVHHWPISSGNIFLTVFYISWEENEKETGLWKSGLSSNMKTVHFGMCTQILRLECGFRVLKCTGHCCWGFRGHLKGFLAKAATTGLLTYFLPFPFFYFLKYPTKKKTCRFPRIGRLLFSHSSNHYYISWS